MGQNYKWLHVEAIYNFLLMASHVDDVCQQVVKYFGVAYSCQLLLKLNEFL